MIPDNLGVASVAAITIICYLIGNFCKVSDRIPDTHIPSIMGFCGGVFGIIGYFTKMPEMSDMHIFTAIAVGVVSGFAATGVNQIFRQMEKSDETS